MTDKSSLKPGERIMHLRLAERDYTELKRAGERACRSPNREALWRLRLSLADPTDESTTTAA